MNKKEKESYIKTCKANKKISPSETNGKCKHRKRKNATAETVIRESKAHYNLSDFISMSDEGD